MAYIEMDFTSMMDGPDTETKHAAMKVAISAGFKKVGWHNDRTAWVPAAEWYALPVPDRTTVINEMGKLKLQILLHEQ